MAGHFFRPRRIVRARTAAEIHTHTSFVVTGRTAGVLPQNSEAFDLAGFAPARTTTYTHQPSIVKGQLFRPHAAADTCSPWPRPMRPGRRTAIDRNRDFKKLGAPPGARPAGGFPRRFLGTTAGRAGKYNIAAPSAGTTVMAPEP